MPSITTFIAILYGFSLWYWLKRVRKTISVQSTKVLLWTHALLLALVCISAFLSLQYSVSFRGMWTFRIIAWLFLLTGVVTFIIGHKSQFNLVKRVYFIVFSTLPTLVGLFLLVPFLGVVLVFSLFGRLIGTSDTILYKNDDIRVQTTFAGVLGPPYLAIYKKTGLFEERVYRSETGWFNKVDSVKTFVDHNTMTIAVYHDK
jgi:hypothetical protein